MDKKSIIILNVDNDSNVDSDQTSIVTTILQLWLGSPTRPTNC